MQNHITSVEPIKRDAAFYELLNVKEYQYWMLKVHECQTYLGQAVIWLKRDGEMQRLSVLNEEERAELWDVVFPEYESAVASLWSPDHMNYAWLGNFMGMHGGHGHFHVIPRYRSPRQFSEREFVDVYWGRHYARESDTTIPLAVAYDVRDALRRQLSK